MMLRCFVDGHIEQMTIQEQCGDQAALILHGNCGGC